MTIASGTNGTCTWTIADNGAMTIRPTSGSSGVLHKPGTTHDWEWNEYIDKIKSVSFSASVLIGGEKLAFEDGYNSNSYMYEMFKDAVNLESIDFTNARVSNLSSMYCAFMGCSKLASLDLSWITSVCSDGVDMSCAFLRCDLLTSVKFGSSLKIALGIFSASDGSTCFVPYDKQCKNNDTGLIVADEVSWFNLPISERAGTWTRGVDSVFKVTAYRSTSTGTADEDGANASFDVVWATSTGTTRNLKIYSKLASESSYGTTPVINTDFTGNSGTNTVTVTDIGEAAHDYRVEFTDGTSTWIAFPSIASNVQLVTIDQDGNVVVLGSLTVNGEIVLDSTTTSLWNSILS